MAAGSLSIFLYALFMFSAEGAPKFTTRPPNPFLALESDNITLEWSYTFVEGESFFLASLKKGESKVVNKFYSISKYIIDLPYRGRLNANITKDYTSITLLGVNRLDMGSYTFTVTSLPYLATDVSTVEISVL